MLLAKCGRWATPWVAVLVAGSAAAYSLHDPPIRWFPQDLPISYYIHYAGEPDIPGNLEFAEIEAGIEVWQAAALSNYGSRFATVTTSSGINISDGQTTISFGGGGFVYPTGVIYVVAVTRNRAQTMEQGGRVYERIVDADIVLAAPPMFATREQIEAEGCENLFDLRSVFAQIWGRVIGLSSSEVPGATLFPTLQPCSSEPASLELDDIRGVRELYPEGFAPRFELGAAPPAVAPGEQLLVTLDSRGRSDQPVDLYLGWILPDGGFASLDASMQLRLNQLVRFGAGVRLPEQILTLFDGSMPAGVAPGVYRAFALATQPGASPWQPSSWIAATTAAVQVLPAGHRSPAD